MKLGANIILRCMFILTVFAILLSVSMAVAEEKNGEPTDENPATSQMTMITGVVDEMYRLVTDDGVFYNIAEGDVGDKLIEKIGQRVSAQGKVVEEEGDLVVFVTSFNVIN